MYQTAFYQGERLEFVPENEDQNDFSRDKGEKVRFHQGILEVTSFLNMMKTPAIVISGVAVEESNAGPWSYAKQGARFSFATRRIRSGRMIKASNKAVQALVKTFQILQVTKVRVKK